MLPDMISIQPDEPDHQRGCKSITAAELLAMEIPPRENLLAPWLPAQGLAMIYAPRGVGKTHLSVSIAVAVASGKRFLNWNASRSTGVLFIDGEMPLAALQERVAHAVSAIGEPVAPLQFITPDTQEFGMPDLSTTEGQTAIDEHITDDIGLIITDNLSTLVRSGKENEGESWQPVQTWALNLRAHGKSVLFIHHAGKGGNQRGTSRREDVLDTVIALKRPNNYTTDKGAVFEIHFEKARGIYGADVQPIEAALSASPSGEQVWTIRTVDDSIYEQVIQLSKEGLSQKEIAAGVDRDKSGVSRHIKRAKDEGLI